MNSMTGFLFKTSLRHDFAKIETNSIHQTNEPKKIQIDGLFLKSKKNYAISFSKKFEVHSKIVFLKIKINIDEI